jgi:hypothetical protein
MAALVERHSHGLKRLRRLARFAYQPGREPIRIDDLISPLRYDIAVRERYFAVVRERRALAEEDFPAFVELSRQQPYFGWFTKIAIPSHHPKLVGDEEGVEAAFERRVRGCIDLHDSFESRGYDRRRPIILRTGETVAPTSTGKRLARRIYAGDGCHRLACLRRAGVEVLEPDMYRLHVADAFTPRDDTALLLSVMAINPHDYFSFLSLSYAERELHTEEELLNHVRSAHPDRLRELQQVIALDSPLLVATTRSPLDLASTQ